MWRCPHQFVPSHARGGTSVRRDSWGRPRHSRFLSVKRLALDHGGTDPGAHVDLDLRALGGTRAGNVRHPDSALQTGREGAAGDLAATDHRVPLAGDALSLDRERDELLVGALSAGRRDRLGADEPGGLPAAPAKARLDRTPILAEVVAVKVKADLEAQRVARAETGRGGAGSRDRVPDARRVVGSEQ